MRRPSLQPGSWKYYPPCSWCEQPGSTRSLTSRWDSIKRDIGGTHSVISMLETPVIMGLCGKVFLVGVVALSVLLHWRVNPWFDVALDQCVNLDLLVGFLKCSYYVKAPDTPQFQSSWMFPLKLCFRFLCILNTTVQLGAASWSL